MAASPNAFAASHNGVQLPSNEHNNDVRPVKRPRLSEDAIASIQTQCAQSDTALEVDHMVLDYAAYQTIEACVASRQPEKQSSSSKSLSSNLAVFESFLSIFKARHPTYKADNELRLRILLVKCVAAFTQRFTSNPTTPSSSALAELRRVNQERARAWIGSADRVPSSSFDSSPFELDHPISQQQLERNRAHLLHELDMPAEDEEYEDAFYGTSSSMSLLDILPLFMEVSAIRNAMNSSNLTDRWMHLACEFMLQACLEQYMVFGANGLDVIDEAFAWGYRSDDLDQMNVDGEDGTTQAKYDETNTMFEDEDYAIEVEDWSPIKASYLEQLFPATGNRAPSSQPLSSTLDEQRHQNSGLVSHLEAVAAEHPITTFEESLMKFLGAISNSISRPALVQLEDGKLDGMTEQQTKEFLAGCGVDAKSFYEMPIGFKTAAN